MMKTTTLLFSSQQQGRLKANQQGMTLIEVLISMFVLAIGILALLSVQLRAVSSVREGETQTIVSQITQNLIEGMLINPVLSADTDGSGTETGRMLKSYNHYLTEHNQKTNGTYKDGETMSKQELAAAQIASFSDALSTALPDAQFHFAICQDNSGSTRWAQFMNEMLQPCIVGIANGWYTIFPAFVVAQLFAFPVANVKRWVGYYKIGF